MANCVEIGEVIETHRDAFFEWVIPDFLDLPKEFNFCLRSPYIPLADTIWYMTIYPNGMRRFETEGWIGLFLHREDSGSPVTVHYQLGFKRAGGEKEIIFGQWVSLEKGDPGAGGAWYLCRATLNDRLPDLVPSKRLTITCRVNCEAHHLLQGEGCCPVSPKREIQVSTLAKKTAAENTSHDTKGGKLLSSATQTDISDITGEENSRSGKDGETFLSSATQTEVSDIINCEENSRRGNDGGRLLSSATQTGVRLLSSTTQTEISGIIFGEENCRKEEDKASFDSEGERLPSSATQTEISDLTICEENSRREEANASTKSFVDEAAQTDELVDGNSERTKEFEKIRQKFKLWMQQPHEGGPIRRMRKEHFEVES